MIYKLRRFLHRFRIYNISLYSNYISTYNLKTMFYEVYHEYPNWVDFQCNFKYNRITKNESIIIYSDRPGLLIGLRGKNIDSLKEKYRAANKHCKDIKIYETCGIKLK